jgi:hypothetical protein
LQIQFNPIGDRIAASFFSTKYGGDGRVDSAESSRVYFYDFAKTFAVFRQVNNKRRIDRMGLKEQKVSIILVH